MADLLKGNAVVAQSGGPTTVINSSACGVIQEALRQIAIETIYGANNGILGILEEDLFDLAAEAPETIEGLRHTPSSAIGSCRHKLGDLNKDAEKYDRVLNVFRAHNIRYFFYIGGNDSMDTADKINHLAQDRKYALRVVGVPKTIDNDLVGTDHCPGYGSVAKYLAASVMEAGRDTEAMHTFDAVTIVEAMGRNTGWIAAATGLAQRSPEEAPNLIYVPEIPFNVERFLADVRAVYRDLKRVFIVVSEGLKDQRGHYLTSQEGPFGEDLFGNVQVGGVADLLQRLIEREIGIKTRYNKPGTFQRNAMHFASHTDSQEAYLCGVEAVRQAVAGTTGQMVALVRTSDSPYQCQTGLVPLAHVANGTKEMPREYLNEQGNGISEAMRRYASPLIQGEVAVPVGPDGLPLFIRFQRRAVPKKVISDQ